MKALIFVIVGYFIFILEDQLTKADQQDCDILESVTNNIDTVILIADIVNLVELPQGNSLLKQLEKRNILKSVDFKGSLYFKIAGCEVIYNLPCSDFSKEAIKIYHSDILPKVKITCLVFGDKNLYNDGNQPF